MAIAGRMRAGFLSGALLFALGQGCALVWQWLLLRHFGAQDYGEVGMAHLGLLTVLALADLGYASLFLREDPAAAHWQRRWQQALFQRLLATLAMDLALVAGAWWQWRGQGAGFAYLLAALPATLFGLVGYSAPLLSQGRRLQGFAVQQIALPVAILAWLVLRWRTGWAGGVEVGVALSLGYLVQMLANVAVFDMRLGLLRPRPGGRRLLGTALRLWLIGLVGTLHDRLTPVLLVAVAPAFVPVYLFLGYLLNGASGIFNQFNRLLLAEVRNDAGERWARVLVSLVLGLSALGAPLLWLGAAGWASAGQRAWLPWAAPVLATGALVLASSVLSSLLIGRHRERQLLIVLVLGTLGSAALQGAAAALSSPLWLLWGRLLGIVAMAAASLRLCRMSLNLGGHAALLSILLSASPWPALGAVLLLPVAWVAWRQRSLLRMPCAAPA